MTCLLLWLLAWCRTTFADLSLLTHPSCQWFVLTTASNFGR